MQIWEASGGLGGCIRDLSSEKLRDTNWVKPAAD